MNNTHTAPQMRPKPSNSGNTYRYNLFVNQEHIGRFTLFSELMDTVKTVSGHIKIQKINTLTNKHTFTCFTRLGGLL